MRQSQYCKPNDTLKAAMLISSWTTTPFTRPQRSKRGSTDACIITATPRRVPRHGSIRSSPGSLNSPDNPSSEVSRVLRQLKADIRAFIDLRNKSKPLKWTKTADQILDSVKRFCHKAQQTYVANFRFTRPASVPPRVGSALSLLMIYDRALTCGGTAHKR